METNETEWCADSNCGCHVDSYATDEKCPGCGKRLRLTGNAQTLALRLACSGCGYQSSILPQEKLHELL
ncbi:MAG: hypothetical protein HYX84_02830 [Chloroflexi bacterium]|nr:hypothetical protein [Chloroflexota bacterium]